MICAPGAITSGFSAWPNGVRPPAEKLVGTPAQVVGTSSMSRVKRTVRRTARAGRGSPEARAVEIGDRPAREPGEERERRIAGSVLCDDHPRRAGIVRPRAPSPRTGSRRG